MHTAGQVSGVRRVIAGSAFSEGGAELTDGSGHEDAGPEKLGERCGDAGSGGQDQGDAPDQGQDPGRGHRPWPFTGRRQGAGAGVLLVTGFSFQRAGPARCQPILNSARMRLCLPEPSARARQHREGRVSQGSRNLADDRI